MRPVWPKLQDTRTQQWTLFFACCLSALAYSLVTGHIWEDFFITFKFSQNLFDGHGLVYEPGTRVHGFTSPLGVLLPGVCYFLTGRSGYLPAIWLFRILCVPFYAGAGVVLLSLVPKERTPERLFFCLLYLLEAKAMMFSVNGMETALMLFFVAAAFASTAKGMRGYWLPGGLAWAGLMWSRPDSCVYIAALGVVSLAFPAGDRRETIRGLLKAAAVTTVIYVPWFAWAWWYYGTPVPHTIIAKAHSEFGETVGLAGLIPRAMARFPWVLDPVYPHFGGWPRPVTWLARLLTASSALYCFAPWGKRLTRMASLLFLLLNCYLALMPFPYPWYFPPAATLAALTFVLAAFETEARFRPSPGTRIAPAALSVVALAWVAVTAGSWYQFSIQQNVVETGNRRRVGEWLRDHATPDDRIYLECLGYIGYFSERRIRDYPGLSSPDVVELSRQGLGFREIVAELQPEWLVLRPHEAQWLGQSDYVREHYRLKALFDVNPTLDSYGYIPGERFLRFDSTFAVFQHDKCPDQAPDLAQPGTPENTSPKPDTPLFPTAEKSHRPPVPEETP